MWWHKCLKIIWHWGSTRPQWLWADFSGIPFSSTYSHPLNWPLFPNAGNCRIKHGGLSCSCLLCSVSDLSLQRHRLVTYCHKQTTPKPRGLEQYPLLLLTIHSWLAASADLGQAWLGICLVTERDTEGKNWSHFCNKSATLTWTRSSTCSKNSTLTTYHCVTLSKSLGVSLHRLICMNEGVQPYYLGSPFCSYILIVTPFQPEFPTSSSSSGPGTHLYILQGIESQMDQIDQFLTYFDHYSFVRPWKHNSKNKSSEFSGEKCNFSAMPEIFLLRQEGQQTVNPPGPMSMALWLLCLYRAESFLIWMLSVPLHPPTRLHQALVAQAERSGTAHWRPLSRGSVLLHKWEGQCVLCEACRSCHLSAGQYTWLLKEKKTWNVTPELTLDSQIFAQAGQYSFIKVTNQ